MGRMVLMQILLRLVDVLPELPLFELGVVGCGAEQVGGSSRDLRLVEFAGIVAERGLGGAGHHLGAGEELGGTWLRPVAVALGSVLLVAAAGTIGVHGNPKLGL